MAVGYVYILLNPSMPGYLKIGKTDRTSEERADELSATSGVPTKFHVAFEVFVSDCDTVERLIHKRLLRQRASADREFFCVPLKDAIAALNEEALHFLATESSEVDVQKLSSAILPEPPPPSYHWKTISDDGMTLVGREFNPYSGLVRYVSKRKTSAIGKWDLPGFECFEVASKWVNHKISLEAAMADSLISLGREDECEKHYDAVDGGHSYHRGPYSDGSYRTWGFKVHTLIEEWKAAVNDTEWRDALALSERLLKEYSNSSLCHLNKAFALHKLGHTSEAKSTLLPIVNSFPHNHLIPYNLACYECASGNPEEAKRWLKRTKSIVSKDTIRQKALSDPDLMVLSNYIRGPIWW